MCSPKSLCACWLGFLTALRLSSGRKKRPVPEDWTTAEDISEFKSTSVSEPIYPGTKSLALSASGELALVGGVDGVAGIYSLSAQQQLTTLKADDGAINDVLFAGTRAITGSGNGVVRIWNEQGTDSASISAHAGAVSALDLHPSGDILASVGVDKSWILYDLETAKSVAQVYDENGESWLTGCQSSY